MRNALSALWMAGLLAAQQTQPPAGMPVFRAEANLVIVNATVRDKAGKPVAGLAKQDFEILEDGKPQAISVFEEQKIESEPLPALKELQPEFAVRSEARPAAAEPTAPISRDPRTSLFRDRRLLALFFDLSSMEAPEQLRAIESAQKFIREQMTAADLVSIVTFGTVLRTEQEFTADRELLISKLKKLRVGESSELAATADSSDSSDSSAFAADESEFNVFNTDRKLSALEQQATAMAPIPEKKSIIYFSSGVGRTGSENESQLRSTVNAAVRANVSFYPVDARGLMALPPGGDASASTPGGSALFSGSAHNSQRDKHYGSQETLDTLASDTGGKAMLDSNDLTTGIVQAQHDIERYYTLGYYSANPARDGKFRKVEVRLARQVAAKIDYRAGYFAEKEFQQFSRVEKERQLEDALLLGDPVTDLPLALEVNWFRMDADKFFVPLAVKIPGSAVPLRKKGSDETTEFDFIGEVRDSRGARVAAVRDAIRIRLRDENAGQLAARSLVYDTGFTLPVGRYKLKLLARENLSGKMGTFEMQFELPAAAAVPGALAMSTVVLGAQREKVQQAVGRAGSATDKMQKWHPLVAEGEKLIPSVTRVFHNQQPLLVYAEVYDPAMVPGTRKPDIAVALSLFEGGRKVFETKPAEVTGLVNGRRRTTALQLEAPLDKLRPGRYTVQLNVIDKPGQRFSIRRAPIVIVASAPRAGAAAPAQALSAR